MARRLKSSAPAKFSLSGIREVINQCSDSLYDALQSSNPNVNQDDIEEGLRALIRSLSGKPSATAESPEEITASVKPTYSFSGDLLVLAGEYYKSGDSRAAFKLFSSALNADDCEILLAGIKEMNGNSDIAAIAEASEDFEDDESSDYSDDEDAAIEDVADEIDNEDPDSSYEDEEAEEDYDEDEEAEDEEADSIVESKMRALANKASLDGSSNARAKAKALVSKAK